ncbi:MAG: hypothetical protein RLZZ617_551 [Bacteroidota bacterium]
MLVLYRSVITVIASGEDCTVPVGGWVANGYKTAPLRPNPRLRYRFFVGNTPTLSKRKPIPMIGGVRIPRACLTKLFPSKRDGELRICGWKEVNTTALS